jgi:hypothetical protein
MLGRSRWILLSLVGLLGADEPASLRMSRPVVVAKIHGFASFEPLPGATLTADDKLMVYYEPSGHTIEPTKDGYRALLTQDGRLRRKGSKDILWQKDEMVRFEPKASMPPLQLFIRTDMAIKGLPPGDYELDLILHDCLAKPRPTHTTRTVAFKVVPARSTAERLP